MEIWQDKNGVWRYKETCPVCGNVTYGHAGYTYPEEDSGNVLCALEEATDWAWYIDQGIDCNH